VSSPAWATFYAVAFSKDFLVVAIDSRATNPLNPSALPNDRYCKIHPLSDDVVFFSTGFVAFKIVGVAFDASVYANEIYEGVSHPANLAVLVDRWGDRMKDAYGKAFAAYSPLSRLSVNNVLIRGYFGGIDRGDRVVLESSEIISESFEHFSSKLQHLEQAGSGIPIVLGGHPEIIKEFYKGGRTERAKAVWQKIAAEEMGKSSSEALAIKVEAFVKAVRDWSDDKSIGGDIEVLILERGHKRRWFHRPDFCPEN
jgi:hypothetical protein